MGRVHTEIGTTMLEWLNSLPAEKKSKSKTICNNTVLIAEAKDTDKGIVKDTVSCHLHGHRIATLYREKNALMLELSCCGWETNTTKNRLNGVCQGISHELKIFCAVITDRKQGLCFVHECTNKDRTVFPFRADETLTVNLKTGKVDIR